MEIPGTGAPIENAPVTIEVPAAHASLFERIKALVERDEQWIVDNIHAGIAHFESIIKSASDAKQDGASVD